MYLNGVSGNITRSENQSILFDNRVIIEKKMLHLYMLYQREMLGLNNAE